MWLIVLTMIIAAVLGFSLSFYFFFHQVKLTSAWRWLGGVVGGAIVAVLLAMTAFMVLWPPANLVITLAGVLLAAAVITVALYGSNKNNHKGEKTDDMDDYQLDVGTGTGS